ncbi:aldo/keto reductase [Natronococcus occultus]|uniref:Aldo/keto reductase, diketogulonate reductase n=1 Tax=Natronococcus occultus SP4 TaxID=694430 RepID=L0K2V1_9EURY|nr:aldo/keto reductase [Natronococcus occultus]AGB39311.1 aldo/keto reductase, diketogulonate reductase [Natronococcus occultus SP4]
MTDSHTIDAGNAAIPALGFGTARMTGDDCREAVTSALEAGYRHLDTAQLYDNEDAVGDALAASDVPREDVFVVTKLDTDNLAREDVLASTRRSLDRLGLGTVDLLLIHAPRDRVPLEETLDAMNELQSEGAVEHIGVSNFSVEQLERARELSATPIVANQVKYHPYHRQDELLSYCADNDVCLTAYSPLAEGAVVGDDRLAEIGERYGKSASQVALRWLLQQPAVAAIPKAASPEHVAANAEIFDFELSTAERRRVFELTDPRLTARIASKLGLD